MAAIKAHGKSISALVISGDISVAGSVGGFEDLKDFLSDSFGDLLPKASRIVVVPGNHDVSCYERRCHHTINAFDKYCVKAGFVTPPLEGRLSSATSGDGLQRTSMPWWTKTSVGRSCRSIQPSSLACVPPCWIKTARHCPTRRRSMKLIWLSPPIRSMPPSSSNCANPRIRHGARIQSRSRPSPKQSNTSKISSPRVPKPLLLATLHYSTIAGRRA